ncbi:hypothetical protein PAXINDRAFT_79710, partial [Paxillus involutus ATCC 200175]
HHIYLTTAEVEYLSEKQCGKLSATQADKVRQQAYGFLEAVGAKIGFVSACHPGRPHRTITPGQNVCHHFHLFYVLWPDATHAALYGSTKTHDTLKKQEIAMVSYAVPFPELAAESKTLGGEVVKSTRIPW